MIQLIKQLDSMKINVMTYLRVNILYFATRELFFFIKVIFEFDRGLIGHYYITRCMPTCCTRRQICINVYDDAPWLMF
jgi:hypothetical protein